jgi:hypothetical protein
MTLIKQAEHRKPFVPVPSALNVLSSPFNSTIVAPTLSPTSKLIASEAIKPPSPTMRRTILGEEVRTPSPNIDLLPKSIASPQVAATDAAAAGSFEKASTLSHLKDVPSLSGMPKSPSFTAPPQAQVYEKKSVSPLASPNADTKKASILSPLSSLPKPPTERSALTSIAAAPPPIPTSVTGNTLARASSIEEIIEDIDDIPEDLALDDADLVETMSGFETGKNVDIATTSPPRFTSPDAVDAEIDDIPLAGLDDVDDDRSSRGTKTFSNPWV